MPVDSQRELASKPCVAAHTIDEQRMPPAPSSWGDEMKGGQRLFVVGGRQRDLLEDGAGNAPSFCPCARPPLRTYSPFKSFEAFWTLPHDHSPPHAHTPRHMAIRLPGKRRQQEHRRGAAARGFADWQVWLPPAAVISPGPLFKREPGLF